MLTFVADFHLSIDNRLDDYKRVLMDQILPQANKSTKFFILGDIYHNRRPHPVEMNIFRDFLVAVTVPTLIVVGNHDRNLDATTIDEIIKWNIHNIKVVKAPYIDMDTGLALYLDHDMIEGAKIGASNLNLDIKGAKKTSLLPKTIKIDRKPGDKNEFPIDFYLFGHIHKAQMISGYNPPILYVGSIEHIDFAERNEDKYMFLIDEKTKKYGYRKLEIRPMIQLDIDLSKELPKKYIVPKGAIAKVVITGTKEQIGKYNEASLREALLVSLKFSIAYKYVRESRVVKTGISEVKSDVECFKTYSTLKGFTEKEVAKGMEVIDEYHKSNPL